MPPPLALLIGFTYQKGDHIPGTIIDLFRAYRFCHRLGYHVIIITDIKEVHLPSGTPEAIVSGVIDKEVMNFLSEDFVRGFSDGHIKRVSNLSDLRAILENLPELKNFEELLIYYTGHGLRDSLMLPTQPYREILKFSKFLNLISTQCSSKVQLFMILDCCGPSSFRLPYKLEGNRFRFHPNRDLLPYNLVVITSASEEEKSFATKYGSLFTRYLFTILEDSKSPKDYPRVVERLSWEIKEKVNQWRQGKIKGDDRSNVALVSQDYKQTVSVYSAYPITPVIWSWVTSERDSPRITLVEGLGVLVVKNKS